MSRSALEGKPTTGKFFLLLFSSVFATVVFNFLGAPFLRVLRNQFGSAKYWFSGVGLAALIVVANESLAIYAFLLFSLWITVGLYQELEERGRGNFWTAILSALAGGGLNILGPKYWAQAFDQDLTETIRQSLQGVLNQMAVNRPDIQDMGVNVDGIVNQLPSVVIILHIVALAFALMLDRKVGILLGLRVEKIASQIKLLEFRTPDTVIWITMFSFLLSFLNLENAQVNTIALNVFNVMMGIYFFQGLAVLEVSFLVFRVGNLFKFLIYLLVVGQLFFLLSIVGVMDYWLDLRRRLKRWRMPEKDPKNGENV